MNWTAWTRGRGVKLASVIALILLPLGIHRWKTALPEEIVLAGGPRGGQFRVTAESLAREIEDRLKIPVRVISTPGSQENFSLLQRREADFGLYTSGTLETLRDLEPDALRSIGGVQQTRTSPGITFVGNMYLQPAHYIVRRDAGIRTPADLRGKRVNMGPRGSGTYAMSLVLLQHFGLSKDSVQPVFLDFDQLPGAFADHTVDAAFIHLGPQSPVFAELFRHDTCSMLSVPNVKALASKYLALSEYTVPRGRYIPDSPTAPDSDVQTVAAHVQLLTRAETPTRLVEEVAKIILSEDFQKRQENRLRELFVSGREFARERPEFAIHPGALRVYAPSSFLDPAILGAGGELLSFTLSFLIACIATVQWLRNRQAQKTAHKLDEFMDSLIDIQRRQVLLMENPGSDSFTGLEKLLDEVIRLRHDALRKFSARELNEDRAVDCFVEMCHCISNEIHGGLLRARVGSGPGMRAVEAPRQADAPPKHGPNPPASLSTTGNA